MLLLLLHPFMKQDEETLKIYGKERGFKSVMAEAYIHCSSYIDKNVVIGKNTKVWHFCHVQEGVVIGENCILGQNVNISNNVKIGNGVKIQNNVSVFEGVEIEDYVFCGPSMVFTNDLTPRSLFPKNHTAYKKTIVREQASIGANATIVCGHQIGKCAMIAAGSVVTKDVLDHALVAGIPARQVGWVCECGNKLNDLLYCEKCRNKYEQYEYGLKKHIEN